MHSLSPHRLSPLNALGALSPQTERYKGVTCREIPDVALASVAARKGFEQQTRTVISDFIGTAPPPVEGFAGTAIVAFWTGANQWMVEAPYSSHELLADLLKGQAGDCASITEQSDAWVRFDLEGDEGNLLRVMELLCNLDPRQMKSGVAVRTAIHHLGTFVLSDLPCSLRIYGSRPSAHSLYHALTTALHAAL